MIGFLEIQIAAWLTIVSVVLVWMPNPRVWQIAYSITVLIALMTGALSVLALVSALTLIVSIYLYLSTERARLLAFLVLITICVAFGLHVLPGFNNQQYLNAYQLNSQSAPFSLWFNYDKSMVGLLLLGALFHSSLIRARTQWIIFLKRLTPILVIGLPAVYLIGLLLGYAHFDWTPSLVFWPWALKNLFFTVIAEELLFRGLIQRELSKRMHFKHSNLLAILLAALLFGIAHFAGGLEYVALSTAAGCVYGYAYYKTNRIEGAIIAHFLLNVVHFLFFSYPFLQVAS